MDTLSFLQQPIAALKTAIAEYDQRLHNGNLRLVRTAEDNSITQEQWWQLAANWVAMQEAWKRLNHAVYCLNFDN